MGALRYRLSLGECYGFDWKLQDGEIHAADDASGSGAVAAMVTTERRLSLHTSLSSPIEIDVWDWVHCQL